MKDGLLRKADALLEKDTRDEICVDPCDDDKSSPIENKKEDVSLLEKGTFNYCYDKYMISYLKLISKSKVSSYYTVADLSDKYHITINVEDILKDAKYIYVLDEIDGYNNRIRHQFSQMIDDYYINVLNYYKYKFNKDMRSVGGKADKNVIGVLFSGGKDSLLRVLELLEAGETVLPIMNGFNTHDPNVSIMNKLILIQLYWNVERMKLPGKLMLPITPLFIGFKFDDNWSGLSQQQINVMSLCFLGRDTLKALKRIEFCLVMNDCSISFIDDIKRIYRDAMRFNSADFLYHDKIPPLVFPYIKYDKPAIYSKIFDFDERHNVRFWAPSCESLEFKTFGIVESGTSNDKYLIISAEDCEKCSSCKRQKEDAKIANIEILKTKFAIPLNLCRNLDDSSQLTPKTVSNDYAHTYRL